MTGIDVAPMGMKRYHKYFKHLAKAAKKYELKQEGEKKLKEQIERTKKSALEQDKKATIAREFKLLEKRILDVLEHEKKMLYREGENSFIVRELKNDIAELKKRQDELATERAYRFNTVNFLLSELNSNIKDMTQAKKQRAERIKELEKKIKSKAKEKKRFDIAKHIRLLEMKYSALKGRYTEAQLTEIKKKIGELKGKV